MTKQQPTVAKLMKTARDKAEGGKITLALTDTGNSFMAHAHRSPEAIRTLWAAEYAKIDMATVSQGEAVDRVDHIVSGTVAHATGATPEEALQSLIDHID